jgi:colanic acid/amylovoran biosynthesis protein
MKNYLIIGVYDSRNNGEMAMVVSTMQNLIKIHGKEGVHFYVLTRELESDSKRYSDFSENATFITRDWMPRNPLGAAYKISLIIKFAFINLGLFLNRTFAKNSNAFLGETMKIYRKVDAVIDLSGDSLSGDYGQLPVLEHLYSINLGSVFNIPTYLCAQSIGPLTNPRIRKIAISVFNRATLVTLREKLSDEFLKSIGVNEEKLLVTSDTAMTMDYMKETEARKIVEEREGFTLPEKFVGLNLSAIIAKWVKDAGDNKEEYEEKYIKILARVAKELSNESSVVLVPHVTRDDTDDRKLSEKVMLAAKELGVKKIYMLKDHYIAQELKGIISLSEVFVGCRMHATVGAISTGVPTLAIGYSHKYKGVIGQKFDVEEMVLDVREVTYDEFESSVLNSVKDLLANRAKYTEKIMKHLPNIKVESKSNFEIIAGLKK